MRDKVHPKTTRQRRVVLEELRGTNTHPTAEELHVSVRRRLPRISLATVYRNLEVLSDQGLALIIDFGGGRRHFDGRTDDHYHVRCTGCGAVADLELPRLKYVEQQAAEGSEWQVIDHEIDFLGICPACRSGRKASLKRQADSPEKDEKR